MELIKMNRCITHAIFLATVILLFSCKKVDEGSQLTAQTGPDIMAALVVEQTLSMDHCTVSGSEGMGIHLPGAAHIQFFDNFRDNTLKGDLGGFYIESK